MSLKLKSWILKRITPYLLILLALLAFTIGILWQKAQKLESGGAKINENLIGQPTAGVNIKDVDVAGEPFVGEENAPAVLVYWFDFQCPFCKKFETDTLPTLIERYVKTGKLKIVFKDFQFLGPDSQIAGLAGHAVWEASPQNYLKWHEAMYEKQDAENGGWGGKADIIALTETISAIDVNKVSQLMESKKDEYQKEQDKDKGEGEKFGITGTPGFIIGDKNISGAQPISVFIQVISALLLK